MGLPVNQSALAMKRFFCLETLKCRNLILNGRFQFNLLSLDGSIPAANIFNLASRSRKTVAYNWRRDNIHSHKFLRSNGRSKGSTNVGADIYVDPSLKLSSVLYWTSQELADVQRPTCRWRLGRIACHQRCLNCYAANLSRRHAVSCFGLENQLMLKYDDVDSDPNSTTFLDTLLNRYFYGSNVHVWSDIKWAVSQISAICLWRT